MRVVAKGIERQKVLRNHREVLAPLVCAMRASALLIGVLFAWGERAQGEGWVSDARFPHEAEESSQPRKVPFYQIRSGLGRLEKAIEKERQALADLAPLEAEKQFNAFGYHSDFIPVVDGVPAEPLWTLDFEGSNFETEALVLVPALDQRIAKLQGYAFPKRFRISSLTSDGEPAQVFVDWTKKDFPNPGMRPVYFSFSEGERPHGDLRLEVFAGEEKGDGNILPWVVCIPFDGVSPNRHWLASFHPV